MAHFVKLDETNKVIEGVVINNDVLDPNNEEASGIAFLQELYKDNATWLQTSYNGNIRYNYAGIGYTYDPIDDAFIPPMPYPSWNLNSDKRWEAPLPYPQDEKRYYWDEEAGDWIES